MCKFLALLFLTSIANAVDTPIAGIYKSFDGGLNNDDASISLEANESPDLLNVVIDDSGALSQRKGYATCGNTPSGNPATNLFEYNKNDGSRNLIVTDNVTIWQTPDCVQYSTITTGLSSQGFPRFAIVKDNLWIVNGSTWPIYWNGTAAVSLDGQGGRPTGPKGKYITYWKSRVWIGNTPTQTNGLYFSALVDTDGTILDPATSTMAWANTLNVVLFGGSGGALYGIKVYRDNLYSFLEGDIYRTLFESEYTADGISVNKAVSKTGSKFNESIVEMDDSFLRFLGRDGCYIFDGAMVKKVSDKWTPTFDSFKQPSHQELFKLWDTTADWNNGTTVGISTVTGNLQLDFSTTSVLYDTFSSTSLWTQTGDGYFTSTGTWKKVRSNAYDWATGWMWTSTTTANLWEWKITPAIYSTYAPGYFQRSSKSRYYFVTDSTTTTSFNGYGFYMECVAGPTTCQTGLVKVVSGVETKLTTKNIPETYSAGGIEYTSATCTNLDISIVNGVLTSSTGSTTTADYCYHTTSGIDLSQYPAQTFQMLYASDMDYSPNYDTRDQYQSLSFDNIYVSSGGYVGYSTWSDAKRDGSFTSQVSTATGLTIWKTFDTNSTLNSQSIAYQIRTAPTAAGVLTEAWRSVSDGVIVSSDTDTYVQWMATFTTTNNAKTPVLNSAAVGWVTGDTSSTTIYGVNYKSRYWLSASTTPGNSYNDVTMVENRTGQKQDGWTRFDLPISAMVLWNGIPYAAIGGTSKIVRLDYGDTDDGSTITSYYDTRDEVYDNPIVYKSINRLVADYSSTPANNGLKIGLSPDLGNTWTYRTINTAGNASLTRNTSIININAVRTLQFRSRVYNDKAGIGFLLYGLYNFGTMSDFIGN